MKILEPVVSLAVQSWLSSDFFSESLVNEAQRRNRGGVWVVVAVFGDDCGDSVVSIFLEVVDAIDG